MAWSIAGSTSAAISIQNFAPASNDRFANDPAFIGTAFDWSGVGRAGDGTWAVMISPSVFLTATHFHAGIGSTLSFFAGNDPGAVPVTGTIAGAQQIGGTDLWVGHLSLPLPGSIATYGFMTVPLSEATFGGSVLDGSFAYLSGLSPTVGAYGASPLTNQAVATNRLEGFADGLSVSGSTGDVLITVENQIGDSGFSWTPFEAQLNAGDSGSPLMVINGGNLVVAGIAWAVGTVEIDPADSSVIRNATAYTYTGNYSATIQDYIAAQSALDSVPEPSVAGILCVAGLIIFARRRIGYSTSMS